ncbi:MAG TPA: hypothetical protein VFC82_02805 [Actinomycetaceae bacterium]|nr:hypothetical protein [Actinomycetaceae bacterium]
MADSIGGLPPSAVRVLTEDEMAQWRRERRSRGQRTVRSGDHWWLDTRGFSRPLHFAATIPAAQIRRPTPYCWAYHALLPPEDVEAANVWSPLHMVEDAASYGLHSLSRSRRKDVRRGRRMFELVHLTDGGMLAEHGWRIYSANERRLGLTPEVGEKEYRERVGPWAEDSRRLVVGALQDGKLVAYQKSFAVDGTAYLADIYLSDAARKNNVSAYLDYEMAQLYRKSGLVKRICAGPPLPERPRVSEFKRSMGMPIVFLPARFWAPGPVARMLSRVRPGIHYRATGVPPRNMKDAELAELGVLDRDP